MFFELLHPFATVNYPLYSTLFHIFQGTPGILNVLKSRLSVLLFLVRSPRCTLPTSPHKIQAATDAPGASPTWQIRGSNWASQAYRKSQVGEPARAGGSYSQLIDGVLGDDRVGGEVGDHDGYTKAAGGVGGPLSFLPLPCSVMGWAPRTEPGRGAREAGSEE